MSLRVDRQLAAALKKATDKQNWFSILSGAMGSDLRIVQTQGETKFRDCRYVGSMAFDGEKVTMPGRLDDTSAYLAVDLAEGDATMRITSGGHWIEGTLGLTGADTDFEMPENPTTENGLGLGAIEIWAPAHLPDGPPVPDDSPYYAVLQDWSTGSAVEVDRIALDVSGENWVFDQPELHQWVGAVQYRKSSETMVLGSGGYAFEFGFHLFMYPAKCNSEANVPVYEVVMPLKPHDRWSAWPTRYTHDPLTDSTIPTPYKIEILDQNENPLHVFEMADGSPINSDEQSQERDDDNALRPYFNTKMMHVWRSAIMNINPNARKIYNGIEQSYHRESMAKGMTACNDVLPINNYDTYPQAYANSLGHMFAIPKWPMSMTASANDANDPSADTYMQAISSYYSGEGPRGYAARTYGWGNEPGAIGGHTQYTPPGGLRFDRFPTPSVIAMLMTYPEGSRLKDGTPWLEMVHHWTLNYANLASHMFTDVQGLGMIPQADWEKYSHEYSYYAPNTGYVPEVQPGSRHVSWYGPPAAADWPDPDLDGRRHFNGAGVDYLHSSAAPGWGALVFGSVANAISGKARFFDHTLAQVGGTADVDPTDGYLVAPNQYKTPFVLDRRQGWRWLQYERAWLTSSSHPAGLPRSFTEGLFQRELEALYDYVVEPYLDPGNPYHNHHYIEGLRRYGIPLIEYQDGGQHWYQFFNDAKAFYLGDVLMMMKRSGMFDVMHGKSLKCAAALDAMIEWLDRFSVSYILGTLGRTEGMLEPGSNPAHDIPIYASDKELLATPLTLYAGWQAWAADRAPRSGVEDLVHDSSGNIVSGGDRSPTQHLREAWVWIRTNDFPEYENLDLEDAKLMYEGFEEDVADYVAAAGSNTGKRDRDFSRRHPGAGIPAPAEV